jgi:hypothetical protein
VEKKCVEVGLLNQSWYLIVVKIWNEVAHTRNSVHFIYKKSSSKQWTIPILAISSGITCCLVNILSLIKHSPTTTTFLMFLILKGCWKKNWGQIILEHEYSDMGMTWDRVGSSLVTVQLTSNYFTKKQI